MALSSITRSPLLYLRMHKGVKCVILIYITIEYIYLRIKLSDLIQGYMKIKGEEEMQFFGSVGAQVPIYSQHYVLIAAKAGRG